MGFNSGFKELNWQGLHDLELKWQGSHDLEFSASDTKILLKDLSVSRPKWAGAYYSLFFFPPFFFLYGCVRKKVMRLVQSTEGPLSDQMPNACGRCTKRLRSVQSVPKSSVFVPSSFIPLLRPCSRSCPEVSGTICTFSW